MKKLLVILLGSILLLGVTGCSNKNGFSVGEESNVVVEDKYVSFEIDKDTLNESGATVVFRNNSEYTVSYGTPYELEIKKDGKWHEINVELFFNMPLMSLNSGESTNLEFNWAESYGELAKGEYRIIKKITVEIPNQLDSFYVSSEFTIK